jgi:ABC-type oligopeptide transport system ATPase subunit
MIINRGLPGSGKSTLSKKIYHLYGSENGSIICSGDDFFVTETGEYKFDASKLADAHTHAQNKASDACRNSISPVIIDNTNIKYWEVNKYLSIARSHNYIVILIEPKTAHKFDVEKLASKHFYLYFNITKRILKLL